MSVLPHTAADVPPPRYFVVQHTPPPNPNPPFPTRRSSDLTRRPMARHSSMYLTILSVSPISEVSSAAMNSTRSEEHTSELQSLRHLVCRLLLEQKKSIHTPR